MAIVRSRHVALRYKDWGPYNNPEVNERKVELPIAFWFVKNYGERLFEIGEVTPFYGDVTHTVCDTLPEKPATLKIDANDLDYVGKNVLAISTVEHVGAGDYGLPVESHKAVALVNKIIGSSNNWLITFAVGSNRELEADLVAHDIDFFLMERLPNNTWRQVEHKNFSQYSYNDPLPHGNAIFVVTNLNVLFTLD